MDLLVHMGVILNKDEALRLALEALTVLLDEWTPARQAQLKGMDAITAIKAALANEALERKAENARELGLDYEPDYKTLWQQMCKRRDDLDKELAATERQVEILSDSLSQLSKQQAKDEPVAWMYPDDLKRFETSEAYAEAYSIEMVSPTQGETVPLYTTPPQRKPLWIDTNDKTQERFLPNIGEPVLFCHGGKTYLGKHTGGSFQSGNGVTKRYHNTWECHWMPIPAAHGIKGEK
jgi:hypothetical protein